MYVIVEHNFDNMATRNPEYSKVIGYIDNESDADAWIKSSNYNTKYTGWNKIAYPFYTKIEVEEFKELNEDRHSETDKHKSTKHKSMKQKSMRQKEREDWDALYHYVQTNVLGYSENQTLARNMTLRLKGLSNKKFMANNNVANNGHYSYEVILCTFKFCHIEIQNALKNKRFKDESHKFNYILKIVEQNLDEVNARMNKNKEE